MYQISPKHIKISLGSQLFHAYLRYLPEGLGYAFCLLLLYPGFLKILGYAERIKGHGSASFPLFMARPLLRNPARACSVALPTGDSSPLAFASAFAVARAWPAVCRLLPLRKPRAGQQGLCPLRWIRRSGR